MPRQSTRHARALRHHQTDAEARLWFHLRDRRLNHHKFRRQYPIGLFVVDFVCLSAGLIVELDGGQHNERAPYDQRRTGQLEQRGFKVLRFWNNDVLIDTPAVLQSILWALGKQKPSTKPESPLPQAGEGAKTNPLSLEGEG